MAATPIATTVILLAGAVVGALLIYAWGVVARRRWKANLPDFISMVAYRVALSPEWPLRERLFAGAVHFMKILGMVLVAMGIGIPLYALFLDSSILQP